MTNTVRYPSGIAQSTTKAASGPSAAPMVSKVRCTPNDRPSVRGSDEAAIIASRGAVRMPLPTRSTATSAVIARKPDASSRPALVSAETP